MRGAVGQGARLRRWLIPLCLVGMQWGCGQENPFAAEEPGHRLTIGAFDTFAGADSVLVVWDTGNYPPFDLDATPPAPPVRSVALSLSSSGPGGDFSAIAEHDSTGRDSVWVRGLQAGRSYFFRLETHDALGVVIDRSTVLETQVGPLAPTVAEFGTVSRDGGQYYPPVAWSRDGGSVFYIEGTRSGGPNLFAHDLGTGVEHAVTAFPAGPALLLGVAVAPDSDQVAFCYSTGEQGGPYHVHVFDLPSGLDRTITEGPVDGDPAWGPGGQVFFTRGTSGPPNIPQIYSTDARSSAAATAVLVNSQYKYGLSHQRGGNRIAYSAYEPAHGDVQRQSLYSLDPASGHVDRLTPDDPWNDQAPAWSEDGGEVYFVSNRSGHNEAWSLNVASGALTQRTRAQERGVECWAARPSPDGTRLAVFEVARDQLSGTVRVLRLP